MNIVVLDGYALNPGDNPWDPVEALADMTIHDRTPPEQIVPRSLKADIVLTNKTPLTADTLAQLPDLKMISVLATGYNIIDIESARSRGIPVSNVPEYSTGSVAEHVFSLILEFYHHSARLSQLVHAGTWQQSEDFCFWETPLMELAGRKIGIIGMGRIGRRVAKLANAFGMDVVAHDLCIDTPPEFKPFAWKTVEAVFAESDIVTVHCPQTAETTGMINRALLKTMKPTAILVNAARGGLVNEADLADALNRGVIAGAAVDVLREEPPRSDNPLLTARNSLITPHVAWATIEARRRMMKITAGNIKAFLDGNAQNVVN